MNWYLDLSWCKKTQKQYVDKQTGQSVTDQNKYELGIHSVWMDIISQNSLVRSNVWPETTFHVFVVKTILISQKINSNNNKWKHRLENISIT